MGNLVARNIAGNGISELFRSDSEKSELFFGLLRVIIQFLNNFLRSQVEKNIVIKSDGNKLFRNDGFLKEKN